MNKWWNLIFLIIGSSFLYLSWGDPTSAHEKRIEEDEGLILILVEEDFSFSRLHTYWRDPLFRRILNRAYLGAMTMRTLGGKGVKDEIATLALGKLAKGEDALIRPIFFGERKENFRLPPLKRKENVYLEGIGAHLHAGGIDALLYEEGNRTSPHPGAFFVVDDRGWGKKGSWGGLTEINAPLMVVEWRNDESLRDGAFLSFLERWVEKFGRKREIWVMAVSLDPDSVRRGEFLAPFMMLPKAKEERPLGGGILTSPTTRRDGFIANVDLYPTLLSHFHLSGPVREGREIGRLEGIDRQETLRGEVEKTFHLHRLRRPLLYQLLVIEAVGILFLSLLLFLLRNPSLWMRRLLHFLFIYLLSIPLLLLLLGALSPILPIPLAHLYLVAGSLLLSTRLSSYRVKEIYLRVSALYIGLLLLDGFLDHTMLKHSILGYDPIIAARFYGIGNEYAGVLIGNGLLLFHLLRRRSFVFPLLLYLLLLIYFASPILGADAGGAMAWLSLPFLLPLWRKERVSKARRLAVGTLLILFLFSSFLLIQLGVDAAAKSHVGWLMEQTVHEGTGVMLKVLKRKMEMNLKLLLHSDWNMLFFISLFLLVGFYFMARKLNIRDTIGGEDLVRASLWVNLIGFFVNDSGVVAASMGFLFAVIPLLHGILEGKANSTSFHF